MTDRERLDIVVIGAGMGGLSAAAHLSAQGHRVTVLEQGPSVGGKAGRLEQDGFRFDTGPTLLTMADVLRRAFVAAGGDLDRDVGLLPIHPETRYFFSGGRTLDVTQDAVETASAIERVFAGEGRAYREFISHAATLWRYASEPYLEAPFTSYAGFAARVLKRGMGAVRLGKSLGTLRELSVERFRTDEMRAFVQRFATYVGGDPMHTSAAYANIAHVECTLGAQHPRGGMAAIAYALAKNLTARGVRIVLDTPARDVQFERDRVVSVRTDHETLRAHAVVVNVDPQSAVESFLSHAAKALDLPALRARERSVSCYALLLGVRGDVAPLKHHSLYFCPDYAREFTDLFARKLPPGEPTLYVNVPSLTEPGVAPEGCHSLYVLVNAPATGDSPAQWDDDSDVVRALDAVILKRLEEIVPGISARIVTRARVTPRTIAALGSVGGAIYGEAPHGATAPFRRPKQRVDSLRGLYLATGSAHPGGGVPMVTLGGEHVARLIHEDLKNLR
ncbi:MAG: phytoene desaturase family protein [Deltaproteobacteria bacterium]|nr:phytoene desaturase family protein [Deltaproteobacteria bacterium]